MASRAWRTRVARAAVALWVASSSLRVVDALASARAPVSARSVYLTREKEKNGALRAELSQQGIECIELPCIEHRVLPAAEELPSVLAGGTWQWVLVTSPEAGSMLIDAWQRADQPALRIASVGAGTSKVLTAGGLTVEFEPSKATGRKLAEELPQAPPSDARVLYPASARAEETVPGGLRARGFDVQRLDVYTTEPPEWTAQMRELAAAAHFVTFASPSAVDAWVDCAGTDVTAICIGETSARRARELGVREVHCPPKPGLKSWAELVVRVLSDDARAGGA